MADVFVLSGFSFTFGVTWPDRRFIDFPAVFFFFGVVQKCSRLFLFAMSPRAVAGGIGIKLTVVRRIVKRRTGFFVL